MLQITGGSALERDHTVSFEHHMDSLTDLKYVNIQRMKIRNMKIMFVCVSLKVNFTGIVLKP